MELMNITIWLTTECNLACTYCYEKDKQKIHMSNETALGTVRFITEYLSEKNISRCDIHFHGGEPLLNTETLWVIVKELINKKQFVFKFSITTNGTVMTETTRKQLIKYIDDISISIDGSQFINDKNRRTCDGESCYDLVMANAKKILMGKSDIIIRVTVVPETVKYLSESILYFIKLGFSRINHAIDYWSNWTQEDFDEYYNQIQIIRNLVINMDLSKVRIDGIDKMKFVKKSKCVGGIYSLNIFSDGDIFPCTCVTGDKQFQIGNIKDGIIETWPLKLDQINNIEIEMCDGCALLEACVSNRCKFFNKVFTGSYNIPCPNVCSMQNVTYQLSKG